MKLKKRGLMPGSVAIQQLTDVDRIGEMLHSSLAFMSPAARASLSPLVEPKNLAIVAGVLITWGVSHAVGIGEIIDLILTSVGVVAIGMAVFDGIDHLIDAVRIALSATTEENMDRSAWHFSQAVSILGIQTVLAILLRSAPRAYRRARPNPGPPPAWVGSRPPLRSTRGLPAGEGATGWWGEIEISRLGTATDRRLAALHESVHRFLSPRLVLLRNFRVSGRAASYQKSALSKYLEEALAETVA